MFNREKSFLCLKLTASVLLSFLTGKCRWSNGDWVKVWTPHWNLSHLQEKNWRNAQVAGNSSFAFQWVAHVIFKANLYPCLNSGNLAFVLTWVLLSPSWTDSRKEGSTYCVPGSVLLIFSFNPLDILEQCYRGGNWGTGKFINLFVVHLAVSGGLWIENQVYVTPNPTCFPSGALPSEHCLFFPALCYCLY